jgi:MGT family glycosyltransferase
VASSRTVVVISSMRGSHIQRLLPMVAGLARRGLTVHVMTSAEARPQVEAAGADFFDLDARYPAEAIDSESFPPPLRLVSAAAAYAEPLIAEVGAFRPGLLLYDSFAVVAPLIARRLAIPYVGMRAGHAQVPARAIAAMRGDSRVVIGPACLAAVETLRDKHGMSDATPFSYHDGVSPYLNLYPEPPRFLAEDERPAFAPLAFVGSLGPELREAVSGAPPPWRRGRKLRVYISFGSVIWWSYAGLAASAMTTLANALSHDDAEVLVSLGNHPLDAAARALIERPCVRVESFVDQWAVLKDADLFVTHHGLNSSHEAVFHGVPMLSYPFLADQPAMARCCQDLGLAVPLVETPRAPLTAGAIHRAVDEVMADRERFTARLAEARRWELEVMAGRDAVLDRMIALT